MTDRGREFIKGEFARLLQDWYQSTEGLAPAEVQVYGRDALLVIGNVLEEFALMQAKYKLLTNHSPLLENDNFSNLVPGMTHDTLWGLVDRNPTVRMSPQDILSLIIILVPTEQYNLLGTQAVLNPPSSLKNPKYPTLHSNVFAQQKLGSS
ncbi:hypothetical protein DSO57_1014564 [Entomophthora muscae]|uniref:Uncharacterized protein n=1 Tax=Entomophthora muscae TaxID=34485 RepID=A0ACC2SU75_9FUNG|nr:hypothetical protein DSO57_1014564 [Entomophthora muscae]